jgi:hypothetical protein
MRSHSVATIVIAAALSLAAPLSVPSRAADAPPGPLPSGVVVRIGDAQMTREEITAQLAYEPAPLLDRLREDDNFARIYAVRWFQAGLFARAAKDDGMLARTPGLEYAAGNLGRNLIADVYTRDLMRTEFKPSDSEIETHYKVYRDVACATPPRYHLARTGVEIAKHASEAERAGAMKRLDEMKKRLAGGESFAVVANEMSDLPSKNPGGDVGWISGDDLAKDESAGLAQLVVGGISEPLKTRRGYEIFRMVEKEESRTKSLPECRDIIVERIESEYRKATAQRRADELAERYAAALDLGAFIDAARAARAVPTAPEAGSGSPLGESPTAR